MRIKLDENMPEALAQLLNSAGHDVSTVAGEGLSGAGDPDILAAATSESRLLMTFDTDFADIRGYPPESHSGIVVFRLADQRWAILRIGLSSWDYSSDWMVASPSLTKRVSGLVRVRKIECPVGFQSNKQRPALSVLEFWKRTTGQGVK